VHGWRAEHFILVEAERDVAVVGGSKPAPINAIATTEARRSRRKVDLQDVAELTDERVVIGFNSPFPLRPPVQDSRLGVSVVKSILALDGGGR
jgi:hypothetical protein